MVAPLQAAVDAHNVATMAAADALEAKYAADNAHITDAMGR